MTLEGKDVLVWFPTGYGRSICYQLLPFVFDVKLGRTNAPLIDRSVILVISPLVSDSTRILLFVSFICIFIEIYNCFTACFTVEFMIAPDTPIYNQYQAVFFARRAVILAKIGLGTRLISTTPHHPSTTPITPSTTTYHPSPLPPHTSLAAVSAFFFAFSASFCCFLIAFFERG